MSTYTDLHIRTKENITILRMPGNKYDGMTPQRVIFANPENIYYGTFKGNIEISDLVLDNAQLNNCSCIGGIISAEAFGYDGTMYPMSIVINNICAVSALQAFQISAEASCSQLCIALSSLSSQLIDISVDVSLKEMIDELSGKTTSISGLSGQLSSLSIDVYGLSAKISDLSSDLHDGTFKLSGGNAVSGLNTFEGETQFTGNVSARNAAISSLSIDLSSVTINGSISSLQDLSDDIYAKLESHSGEINYLCSTISTGLSAAISANTSSIYEMSTILSTKLASSDLSLGYVDQYLYLCANENVVCSVDCADFIKDGMLSNVELCGNQMVFWFNTETGPAENPISVDLSNFFDPSNYYLTSQTSSASEISNALSAKQDKLTEAQLSSINDIALIDPRNTIVQFEDSSISAYSIVGEIDDSCIENLSNATYVKIGTLVASISDDAFKGCENLEKISIPDTISSVGSAAFDSCTSLTSLVFSDAIKSIGSNAFKNCSKLSTVAFLGKTLSQVESIGTYTSFGLTSDRQIITYATEWQLSDAVANSLREFKGQMSEKVASISAWDSLAEDSSFRTCISATVALRDIISGLNDMLA